MTEIDIEVSSLYSDTQAKSAVRELLTGGDNVSLTYDDVNDVLTVSATDTNTQRDPTHTNPTYDSNEDGTIDAPINTTSVETDELSINNRAVLPSQARAITYRDITTDPVEIVSIVDGTEVYRGSDAATAIMSAQNALMLIDGTPMTDDFSTFSTHEGGLHLLGTGPFIISTPITPRNVCPLVGIGCSGWDASQQTTLFSDGNVSKVVHIPQNNTDPYGWGNGGYEDNSVRHMKIAGDTVDDDADLLVVETGNSTVISNLEIGPTRGYGLYATLQGAGADIHNIRVEQCGSGTTGKESVSMNFRGTVQTMYILRSLADSPPAAFSATGHASISHVYLHAMDATSELVNISGTVSLRHLHIRKNSGAPIGLRMWDETTVYSPVLGKNTCDVGIDISGFSSCYSPYISETQQHGIVARDEAVVENPKIDSFGKGQVGTYDGIRLLNRSGGVITNPFIDGDGNGRHGIYFDSGCTQIWGIRQIQNITGDMIYIQGPTDDQTSIWFGGVLNDGTPITSADITTNSALIRWNGVLGGGPLEGVDLSSVSGQFEGDRAVADGTGTVSAGDEASWDSATSQWRVFQPTTTV